MSKRSFLLVALVLFVAVLVVAPARPAYAQSAGWLYADIRVKCASGALAPMQTWNAYFQRDNGTGAAAYAAYNGIYNGERVYIGGLNTTSGNWKNKIVRTGYDSGWSGFKFLPSGGSAGWVYHQVLGGC